MRDPRVPGGWTHFTLLPFETLFGLFTLVGGALGLIHYGGTGSDAVSALLPGWLNSFITGLYAISGLLVLVGLWKPRRDIEAAGLIILAASALVRTAALFIVVGLSDVATISFVFNALIIAACSARLASIVRREVIVAVRP